MTECVSHGCELSEYYCLSAASEAEEERSKQEGAVEQSMPMRVIIAGYSLSLLATIIGCIVIARSRHAGRGMWWLIGALSSALISSLLFAAQAYIPLFFSVILLNEAVLISFVLLHQTITTVLESSQRYIWLSVTLILALFVGFVYFTYAVPDLQSRIMVRTAALMIQTAASAFVLFRHKDPELRDPIRLAGSVLAAFSFVQASRLVATMVWTPSPDRLHLDAIQAFFTLLNFILGLGSCFAIVWLTLWTQRQDLHVKATTDGLSGLMNRRTFDEVLARELQCKQEPLALLMIDLDYFKAINDEHGHQIGDEVIRRVSQLLSANTRAMDAVARYGGEEFAMILKGLPLEKVESVAERLRSQIETMVGLPEPLRVTASIGIAMKCPDDTIASLVKRSDEALYLSKRTGRNRVSTQQEYGDVKASGDLYLT